MLNRYKISEQKLKFVLRVSNLNFDGFNSLVVFFCVVIFTTVLNPWIKWCDVNAKECSADIEKSIDVIFEFSN